jgi:hypothetical protein
MNAPFSFHSCECGYNMSIKCGECCIKQRTAKAVMTDMKTFLIAGIATVLSFGAVSAAEVTNKDSKPVVVVIVDGGNRMDVAIDAGATESVCPSGCFLTTPNGDRVGLSGADKVEISGGVAVVK